MHYVGANLGENGVKNRGYPYWISTPNERVLSYQVPDVCAKFHQNRLKIVTVRVRTARQTHKQTHRDDRGDLIICPMLCYSIGTDNYATIFDERLTQTSKGKTYFRSCSFLHLREKTERCIYVCEGWK